jgi:hypothetical protein
MSCGTTACVPGDLDPHVSEERVARFAHTRDHGRAGPQGAAVTGRADDWIRRTMTGCMALLALIAGTVSYLHMHPAGCAAWAARMGRLAYAAVGRWDDRGRINHAACRVAGWSARQCAAVGAASGREHREPGRQRRSSRAYPDRSHHRGLASFALTASDELLTRQVRRGAPTGDSRSTHEVGDRQGPEHAVVQNTSPRPTPANGSAPLREVQRQAWRWTLMRSCGRI